VPRQKSRPAKGKKTRAGRKLFDGKKESSVIAKWEYAWMCGMTDVQACAHADVSVDALQRYYLAHPELRERKARLQNTPGIKARLTVYRNLKDISTARWFLERTEPESFAPINRVQLSGHKGGPINTRDEAVEKINAKLDALLQEQRTAALAKAAQRAGVLHHGRKGESLPPDG
jgi:hypothetical protein